MNVSHITARGVYTRKRNTLLRYRCESMYRNVELSHLLSSHLLRIYIKFMRDVAKKSRVLSWQIGSSLNGESSEISDTNVTDHRPNELSFRSTLFGSVSLPS